MEHKPPERMPPLRRVENHDADIEDLDLGGRHEFERLDPAVRFLWFLSRAIFWGLILAVVFFIGLVNMFSNPGFRLYFLAGLAVLGLIAAIHLFWPFFSYRHWGYSLRRNDLVIKSGVLFKRISAVPFSRIQHVDSDSGPIERTLGLANLVVHTAGAHVGSLSVPGLPVEQAEALRDYLSKVGHTHANI